MILRKLKKSAVCLTLCAALLCGMAASASAAGFQDVPAEHWASAEIGRCVELGFFKGQSSTHFGLGESMTRASVAVVLCRFFGWETTVPSKSSYTDVPADAWYAGAVKAALEHGALTRQRDTFRPAEPITREELTVMLLRAMGYTTLAGLAQDLSMPFKDVDTNRGYIALAYDMGLMNGTAADTFAPQRSATREQVAVILMRLYDKLQARTADRAAILTAGETLPDLSGFDTAAVAAARLTYTGTVELTELMEPDAAAALRDAALAAGTQALLHVEGSGTVLNGEVSETAALLTEAVDAGGYDGLFLDIQNLSKSRTKDLTELAAALRSALGDKLLYLTADAPAWQEGANGYDYAALGAAADRLVLRVEMEPEKSGTMTIAPQEPLEQVYYAMRTLKNSVPPEKLSLLLTTGGARWQGSSKTAELSDAEIQALLEAGNMESFYSDRYACAYLWNAEKSSGPVVWYLNGDAAAARMQMLRLFGSGVCLSDLQVVGADVLAKIK